MDYVFAPEALVTELPILPTQALAWRWVYGGLGAGLALGGGLGLAWFVVEGWDLIIAPVALVTLSATLLLAGAALGLLYAGLRYRWYRAQLHAGLGMMLQDGVWWRSQAWVPIARLQHIEINQGPLDRKWGMATLRLVTAGRHDHQSSIRGLPLSFAHDLRANLLAQVRSEHG